MATSAGRGTRHLGQKLKLKGEDERREKVVVPTRKYHEPLKSKWKSHLVLAWWAGGKAGTCEKIISTFEFEPKKTSDTPEARE